MDLDIANYIKDIFVWLITFWHITNYNMVNKKYLFIKITSNLGQNVFSIFLLYSGFRINESFGIKRLLYKNIT